MTISEYIAAIDETRRSAYERLLTTVTNVLPEGFVCIMQYDMPTFVIPKELYPAGYHVNPELPLPFLSIGVQKNHISLYHLGLYADPALLEWFVAEYPHHVSTKLNMGKSCIRFSNINKIPYTLIEELVSRQSVDDYIKLYESNQP